jgi:hypothetical protein
MDRKTYAAPALEQVALEQIGSPEIRQLHAYWHELRAGLALPPKSAFDPVRLKRLLPRLVLAEIHDEHLRIRYRLVGTGIVRTVGFDFTGRWHDEVAFGPHRPDLQPCFQTLHATRAPVFAVGGETVVGSQVAVFEWGMMPFGAPGDPVTYALVIEIGVVKGPDPDDPQPVRRGRGSGPGFRTFLAVPPR